VWNRYLAKLVLACLGMIIIISLQGSPRVAQVLSPISAGRNPAYAVQTFYKAVERGDWIKVRGLTTKEYWDTLEQQGQLNQWQNQQKQDSSLEFAGFTVLSSKVEQEEAIIDGRAVWVSALGNIPRVAQTIILKRGLGGWYINAIETRESSTVIEKFYLYLSQGQWEKCRSLVQSDTWQQWEARGLIRKLKDGYGKASPYVTGSLVNSREEAGLAEAQVDLVWMLPQEVKTMSLVKLSKTGDKWVIRQIDGGWPK